MVSWSLGLLLDFRLIKRAPGELVARLIAASLRSLAGGGRYKLVLCNATCSHQFEKP